MTKRRAIIVAACVVGVTLVVVALPAREDLGPVANGRPLGEWLFLISPRNVDCQRYAEEGANAIRLIGTDAMPYLVRWARYESQPSRVKLAARNFFRHFPILHKITPFSNWAFLDVALIRADAVPRAFVALGPLAAPAIDELKRTAEKGSHSEWCVTNVNAWR